MTIELIAEISGNHMGKQDRALDLIKAAAAAGCTGVKFQCFDPERLAYKRASHPRLQSSHSQIGLQDLYGRTWTPPWWFPELIDCAKKHGLTWHASAFDVKDVNFLEELDCPRYKIASFEALDHDLVMRIIQTRKPVIISANQDENITPHHMDWTVLHATNYGVSSDKANLFKMRYWARDRAKYGNHHWKWGLSDHTITDDASVIATALGACMIEWHIKEQHTQPPDNDFSWDPETLSLKIRGVRYIERCLNGA